MTTSNTQTPQKDSTTTAESLANRLPAGKNVAKALGVAAAALAGVVAVRAVRRKKGSNQEETIFHLKQADDQWALMIEGEDTPKATFATKDEGLKAARELAQQSTPCELFVYRVDGTVQDQHTYES